MYPPLHKQFASGDNELYQASVSLQAVLQSFRSFLRKVSADKSYVFFSFFKFAFDCVVAPI